VTAVIRPARSEEEIRLAHRLEEACYPPELAASLEAFLYRWRTYPDYFLTAWEGDRLVGLACGVRTDAEDCSDVGIKKLHGGSSDGRKLCVLSVAVDESRRGEGLGAKLLAAIVERAKSGGLAEVLLMCQRSLVRWYEANGFRPTGLIHDEHGGVEWHDMLLKLSADAERLPS